MCKQTLQEQKFAAKFIWQLLAFLGDIGAITLLESCTSSNVRWIDQITVCTWMFADLKFTRRWIFWYMGWDVFIYESLVFLRTQSVLSFELTGCLTHHFCLLLKVKSLLPRSSAVVTATCMHLFSNFLNEQNNLKVQAWKCAGVLCFHRKSAQVYPLGCQQPNYEWPQSPKKMCYDEIGYVLNIQTLRGLCDHLKSEKIALWTLMTFCISTAIWMDYS